MVTSWAKELKGSSFAVIAADYAWGHDSATSFKKAVEAEGKKVPLSFFAPPAVSPRSSLEYPNLNLAPRRGSRRVGT